MITIRYVESGDRAFWRRLDPHLPEVEFEDKVRTQRAVQFFSNFLYLNL